MSMKVTKIGGKGNILELEITGMTPAYINTLRRLIINEVPTLAIETVEFRQNSSALYDEMLAHRMGLVPLTTDLTSYEAATAEEIEKQEYTAKSSVKATLTAKGPCTVYARDLKFKDPKVKPVYPEMPLVKLIEGQELELEATAVLGRGRDHTKWSPGLAYFHEIAKDGGKSLPVADERGQKGAALKPNLEHNTGHYYFRVESWGQMRPQQVLDAALTEFNKLLKEFDALLA